MPRAMRRTMVGTARTAGLVARLRLKRITLPLSAYKGGTRTAVSGTGHKSAHRCLRNDVIWA
jgi:hypothetical protein